MTVSASLSFTQNSITPGPGISMVGAASLPVTLTSNPVAGGIRNTFEILDVPLTSAVATGIIYSGPNSTCQFTPDAPPGCYRVRLIVQLSDGSAVQQIRNFAVPTAVGGLVLPSFKATADELNFPGNTEGWEQILNEWLLYLLSNSGGGGIPILTADPPSPVEGDEWFLHIPSVPATQLAGGTMIVSGAGNLNFVIGPPASPADLTQFGDPAGMYGSVNFNPMAPPGTVTVTASPGNPLNVQYDGTTRTWNDVVAAINSWALANLTAGVAPICSLSNPADGALIPGSGQYPAYLNGNGSFESVTLRLYTMGQKWEQQPGMAQIP